MKLNNNQQLYIILHYKAIMIPNAYYSLIFTTKHTEYTLQMGTGPGGVLF